MFSSKGEKGKITKITITEKVVTNETFKLEKAEKPPSYPDLFQKAFNGTR